MSKKLIGKARQKSRKKSSNEARKKSSYMKNMYKVSQFKRPFVVNAGKTISSEVEVIKLNVKRSEKNEMFDFTYMPVLEIKDFNERFADIMSEPLARPFYELMQILKTDKHRDEVSGILLLGCGMTEKGIDLPLEINGVDTLELLKLHTTENDYAFFSVKKNMDTLRILDEMVEAA